MTGTIRGAVLRERGARLVIEELTLARLGPSDVRVRMTASDICGRDAAMIHGAADGELCSVLGHEGAGVVEAVGTAVSRTRVGDTVILKNLPGIGCGDCYYCTRQQSIYCERPPVPGPAARFVDAHGHGVHAFLDLGTLAESIVTSERAVVPIETDLPPEQLALLGCPVRAGCWAVLNTAEVAPGSNVAIFGAGPVGLAMVQAARVAGASQVIVVEPLADRRDRALRLGASDVVDPTSVDAVEAVRELTQGRGADYTFEAVRLPETYAQTISASRRGGTAVLAGIPRPDFVVTLPAQELSMTGRRILGSHAGRYDLQAELRRYVRLAEAGQLDLGSLVTRTVDITRVNEVFDDLADGAVIRSVVRFG